MADRAGRILGLLGSRSHTCGETQSLCEVAADVTASNGAGIMLLSEDLVQGSLCSTDPVSLRLEDLQYTLGEGPCVDAHMDGRVVAEPDLAAPKSIRWQAFSPLAIDAGARALFSYPVRVGAARLGALSLFRDCPGPLTDDQHADALVVSDVSARSILALQADAPPGSVAAEFGVESSFHFIVHQAAGMVSLQLDVSVTEALVRLRARAFRTGRPIGDLSRDIVDRTLKFETGS